MGDGVALSIVVPTRNEAENIEPLVARVGSALDWLGGRWEMLFVDDSDDATPSVVCQLAAHGLPLRLAHRSPEERMGGLGGAVVLGFSSARGEVLTVMDADLQHPPEILSALVMPVLFGDADLVVGSRWGAGGSKDGLDGPWRHFVSNASRALVHLLVPRTRGLHDPLSGLFAMRRSVVEGVALRPEGYKILLEVAVRGHWGRVANMPFSFAKRNAGESKASLAEGFRFLRHLARLVPEGWRAEALPSVAPGA
jgi:dolichol-phosphate mannosyltransferase